MEINLIINEKTIELDEFLNEDDMNSSPFIFSLAELSQYVNGHIDLAFNDMCRINLDLFSDFMVCFDDIVDSIKSARSSLSASGVIWFCEQGSDFYLSYEVSNNSIIFDFKKGVSVGAANRNVPNFSVEVNRWDYASGWIYIFQEISGIFLERLNKKIAAPF